MKTPNQSCRSKLARRLQTPTSKVPGVHKLPDLLGRCTVDEDTGCWIWRAGASDRNAATRSPVPVLWYPPEQRITQAARAAWLLAGFPLEPGEIVFRYTCMNGMCVHPLHGAAGTRSDMNQRRAETGLLKADAAKRSALSRARAAMMLSPERVASIEALIDEQLGPVAIARAAGVCLDTVKAIERGTHPYSRGRARELPGASVFSLAAAL